MGAIVALSEPWEANAPLRQLRRRTRPLPDIDFHRLGQVILECVGQVLWLEDRGNYILVC